MAETRVGRLAGLADLPKADLGLRETPLEQQPALARLLGLASPLLVKRDDLAGPGTGGNKMRKLQYVLADALRQDADCLITVGAVQSNHARSTAIVGAMAGLEVHLVLAGDATTMRGGNLVLNDLVGAHTHFITGGEWDDLAAASEELEAELARQGRRPYLIPLGASTPLGAVGYAEAYLEILGQLDATGTTAEWLVHGSGSGGTQAGLLAGRAVAGRGPRIIGVKVGLDGGELKTAVGEVAAGCLRLLRSEATVPDEEVVLAEGAGPGYGIVFDKSRKALKDVLVSAGLLLDPVYTSKAFAALQGLIGTAIPATDRVIFVHTGGIPAVLAPAYEAALKAEDDWADARTQSISKTRRRSP